LIGLKRSILGYKDYETICLDLYYPSLSISWPA
jgi:hypothetical protein